jgi:hypothetical protein
VERCLPVFSIEGSQQGQQLCLISLRIASSTKPIAKLSDKPEFGEGTVQYGKPTQAKKL